MTSDDRANQPQDDHVHSTLFIGRDRRGASGRLLHSGTHEELLAGLPVPAWQRIATVIFLSSRPGGAFVEQVVIIDPLELAAAQESDAGRHTLAEYHGGYLDQNNGLMN